MYRFTITTLLLLACLRAAAQQSVHGIVGDTLNHKKIHRASVVLINMADTTLATFTRTAADGSFTLRPDTAGSFLLVISYPDYATYRDNIVLRAGQRLEVGSVALATKAQVLQEFVVRRKQSAIRINGDTTEFAADSFHVAEGATVESLLKKLPGIQIDRNGSITAQGEQVQKLLVDGEEFFSDDPAVVTQSLAAKTVETVQVYDKKSDAAILTGIDDGQRQKTINLKLKENMKRGSFGKVALAGGTDGYYENQAMVNAFKGKRQISAFGIISNTGTIGLGWGDRGKYSGSGGGNTIIGDDGSITTYYMSNGDDLFGSFGGQYNGEGLPTAWTGGLHYANKWNEGKEHLSGNYRYAKQEVEAVGNTFTQYILPDSQYFSNQRRESTTTADKHGADAFFEYLPDTTSSIQVTASGDYTHSIKNSDYYTETLNGNGGMINSSRRRVSSDAFTKSMASSLLYSKKFKKTGRNAMAQLRQNYKNTDGTGFLFSDNHFYTGIATDDTTNQYKTAHSDVLSLYGKASFTEPLNKLLLLNVGYSLNFSSSNSELLSFDREGNGWSDDPNSFFSSSYKYNVATHSGSTSLNYKKKQYGLTIGADVFHTSFLQQDQLRDTSFSRSYNNYSPMAAFTWEIRKQTNLRLNYKGNTQQPTLEQIQPLRQNTDPLNVAIGNPELRQSFSNAIDVSFNRSKVLAGQYMYARASLSFVNDAISQKQYTDEIGRRSYQYINVNGNYNGSVTVGGDKKFKEANFNMGGNLRWSRGHYNNYVNGALNTSDNSSYTVAINFNKQVEKGPEKDKKQVFSIYLSPSFTYNDNSATLSALLSSYWTASVYGNMRAELPWKMSINSNVQANFRERTAGFDRNNDVITWNADIGRKLLKGDVLEIKLMAYDILNQNIGYSRYAQNNYITENSYNTVRRRIMLNATWNFSNNPSTTKKETGK